MAIVFLNNFSTVTASPLAPADTTLELQDGIADIAAALTGGNTLVLTLFTADDQGNETQREIIHVTAADEVAGTMTIERAQEGAAAGTWAPNTGVEQRLTAGVMGLLIQNTTNEPTSVIIGGGDGDRGRSNCVVIGPGSYVDRDGCLAIGVGAKAEDSEAFVIGNNAIAESTYSMAIGHGALADNDDCVVIGRNASSGQDSAIVIGNSATSSDRDAVVIGVRSSATGDDCVVIGQNATGEANDVIAIGESARASGKDAIAIGQDSTATGSGSIAIGERVEAHVPGGMRFGAVSYVPKEGASQTAGMPSVIASGEIDLSDGAASRTVEAPSGMLLMPDSIEFLLSEDNSGYAEKVITPEGLTGSNTGGFIRKNADGSLLLYSDGTDAYLLNLPSLTLVSGAPSDLEDIEDASFGAGYLAVARASGPHPSVSVYDTSDWTDVSGFTPISGAAYRVAINSGSKIAAIQESAGQYYLIVVNIPEWTVKNTGVSFASVPNAIAFDFKTFGILVVTESETKRFKEDFISKEWASDRFFTALPGGSGFYMSPNNERAFITDSGGTGKVAVYSTDDYSLVTKFPSPATSSGKVTSLGFSGDGSLIFVAIDEAPGVVGIKASDWSESAAAFPLTSGVTSIIADDATGEVYATTNDPTNQPLSILALEDDSASLKVGGTAGGSDYAAATQITTKDGVGARVIPGSAIPPVGVKTLYGSVDTPSQFPSKAKFVVRGYFIEV